MANGQNQVRRKNRTDCAGGCWLAPFIRRNGTRQSATAQLVVLFSTFLGTRLLNYLAQYIDNIPSQQNRFCCHVALQTSGTGHAQ